MADVVGLALPAGPGFLRALRRVWDDGDAVLPIDPTLPPAARDRLLSGLAPSAVVDEHGERHERDGVPTDDGDALVVATSGTTGEPRHRGSTRRPS
ncbi:MAG: hypothetical protein AAGK32_16040, partial [Actinomycetota bacterium]